MRGNRPRPYRTGLCGGLCGWYFRFKIPFKQQTTMHGHSHYHLIFRVSGINEFGAAIGKLTLYHRHFALIVSDVFSGGLSAPEPSDPIPSETYHIRLDVKATASSASSLVPIPGSTFFKLHNFYGIEKIDIPEAQVEWGHYRAALNEPRQGMPMSYRGNFLHGKLRSGDYTHGCICERSESILQKLWSLPPQKVSLTVEKVGK